MVDLFRSKIFLKQFLSFFSIICITFLTISGVLLTTTRMSLEKQQLYTVQNYRMQASQAIFNWFNDMESYLKVQALCLAQLGADKMNSEEVFNIIDGQFMWNKSMGDILILDDKGKTVNSLDGPEGKPSIGKRRRGGPPPGVEGGPPPGAEGGPPAGAEGGPPSGAEGGSLPKGFHKGAKSEDPIMFLSQPIMIDGKKRFEINGVIGLDRVRDIVEKLKFGEWGHAYLINSEGMFITNSDFIKEFISNGGVKDKEKHKIDSYAVRQLLQKKEDTKVYTDFTGEKVYGSFEWLEPLQVGLIVEFRDSKAMEPIYNLERAIGLLAIAVLVLGMIFAFFLSRRLVNPIKMLISATENIIDQSYHESIHIKTGSELDILINNFNNMQSAIRAREEQLQHKNQELKEQTAEAREANKLKSQFLANMSHELRTPLNSIIGFTNRVLKKCTEILPQVQVENLKIVREEAHHLLDLINSLLDYSKIEAGKMEVTPNNFDIREVVEEVFTMTKTLIEDKPIKFETELYTEEYIAIYSDRLKVKQIFINLLSNAFKYSEKGTVRLSINTEGSYYIIKVKDEGIGIATENIKNIFDEFRQIDGSYTRKVGGTGLGLSITKRFVEMLGGKIMVESVLNQGSCFTVYLPAEYYGGNKSYIDNKHENEGLAVGEKKKVICVDDDPNVQRLYKQYLEEHGFEVDAFTGHENIATKVEEIMPDVVLLDIMLPNRNGWEVLAEIKSNTKTCKIPVIMISILNEKGLTDKLQADEYIIKPVSQHDLIETVTRIISNKKGIFEQ